MHMEFCVSLDHYARAQPQIDQSTGLGTDSFKAGQPDTIETAIPRSNSFESIWTDSKRDSSFKMVLNIYIYITRYGSTLYIGIAYMAFPYFTILNKEIFTFSFNFIYMKCVGATVIEIREFNRMEKKKMNMKNL